MKMHFNYQEAGKMKVAIIYWSKTGNTEKVAFAIKEGLEASGVNVVLKRTEEARILIFTIMT